MSKITNAERDELKKIYGGEKSVSIIKNEDKLLDFLEQYKNLHKHMQHIQKEKYSGVCLSPSSQDFKELPAKEKELVKQLSSNNVLGIVEIIKQLYLYPDGPKNEGINLWTFWGVRTEGLKNCIKLLDEYNSLLKDAIPEEITSVLNGDKNVEVETVPAIAPNS